MADKVDISAVARVVDQASGPLRNIERAIGSTGQAARTASTAVARLGSAGLFGGLAANMRGVGSAAARLGGQIKGFIAPVLGLAGVAGIGGAIAAMKSYIDTGNEVSKVSRRLGISAEDLQKFRYAAGGPETADDALTKLQKTLATVSAGGKKVAPTAALLSKFGITLKDVRAGDISTILPRIAEGFKRNENPILRARMAMALFGKSGQTLINFLAKGREGLAEAGAEAERLGLITNEEASEAKRAAATWRDMNTALTGVKNAIGAELLPVLIPIVDQFKEWLVTNRQWLRVNIAAAIKSIADAIKSIDWTAVLAGFERFGRWLEWGIKMIGGWENAFIALIGIMNASLINSVLRLALAIGKLALSAIFAIPQIISTGIEIAAMGLKIGKAIPSILSTGPAIAKMALAAATSLGPIGLAIAAVTAFAVAAYVIYRNWDTIGPFIDAQMTTVKGALDSARNAAENWAATVIPESVQQAWFGFADRLGEAMTGIKATLAGISPAIDEFSRTAIPGPVQRAWFGLADAIGNALEGVKSVLAGALPSFDEFVGGALTSLASLVPQPVIDAGGGLTGFFRSLWDDVLGLFERAKQAVKSAVDWIVAAVEPLLAVIATVKNAIGVAGGVVGAVGGAVAGAARGALDYGRGLVGAAPAGVVAAATATTGPNLLQQQAATAAAAPPQRSEIEQRLKVNLSPDLRASLQSQRTSGAPVRAEVDIGRSMEPALGLA
jgi:hypothetical protein